MRTLPDKITTFSAGGAQIRQDGEGFLVDPDDWNEDVARVLAEREGIELCPDHWAVFAFMRDYYAEHGVAADARFAMRFIARENGLDKRGARARLFELFPYGYVKQACRIAGMRQPRAWSTG